MHTLAKYRQICRKILNRSNTKPRVTPEIEIVETDIDAEPVPKVKAKAQVAPSPSLLGRLVNKQPPCPLEMKRQQEERRASRMHNFLANLE